jgi:hypothetical protein
MPWEWLKTWRVLKQCKTYDRRERKARRPNSTSDSQVKSRKCFVPRITQQCQWLRNVMFIKWEDLHISRGQLCSRSVSMKVMISKLLFAQKDKGKPHMLQRIVLRPWVIFSCREGKKSREGRVMVHSDNAPIHTGQVLKTIQPISESSEWSVPPRRKIKHQMVSFILISWRKMFEGCVLMSLL